MDEFTGTITAFAFNFLPRGWAACNGQLLPIASYQALFALIGTIYGGDGRTTFALPDLRGHAPIGMGQAPGFTNRTIGEKGGTESNILNANQLAVHAHSLIFNGQNINASVGVPAVNDSRTSEETEGNILANHTAAYAAPTAKGTTLAVFNAPVSGTAQTSVVGASSPINNMQPFLVLNYCICLDGIFPPRN